MGDSIGRDSLLRSVLESCRKVLEVGTSKKISFFFNGTYYRAFKASTYEFSIIGNSRTKAICSNTKLQIYVFWKADKIHVSRNEKMLIKFTFDVHSFKKQILFLILLIKSNTSISYNNVYPKKICIIPIPHVLLLNHCDVGT